MPPRTAVLAAVAAAALALAAAAEAKTFRWAYRGDVHSLDPHALDETFTIGFHSNVYEGLVRRGPSLELRPALATSWELVAPTRWRFHLREGVTFHNGNPFDADDVIFSFRRILARGSDMTGRLAPGTEVIKVDDHTVDFVTDAPDPILHFQWDAVFIMDKEWSEAHGAAAPSEATGGAKGYAAAHANGTGPFQVVSREAGVRTVLEPNPDWWDEPEHNLSRAVFTPIPSDAARVAALLSGEVDMVYPVPVRDLARIEAAADTDPVIGPELRTIFLGMDQMRDRLLDSSVEGANPFRDVRVREAVYRAIDVGAIHETVMRGLSTPSALLISPFLFARSDEFERLAYDPDESRALLAEAGYGEGFRVGMDCPNDRYVNDEAICRAVAAMLAEVGIRVDLLAQPKAQFFAKVLGYDTSFYLLGWTPGSFDSWNVLDNLVRCLDRRAKPAAGKFNLGGYCNPRIDELTDKIRVETDTVKRNDMIARAYRILHEDRGYIPLHQQGLAWGKRRGVDLVQRPDNVFLLSHVTVR